MNENHTSMPAGGEPVEISTRMSQGEWTDTSVADLLASYTDQLRSMGAPEAQIVTEAREGDDGSMSIKAVWNHVGTHTFNDFSSPDAPHSYHKGEMAESVPQGETTEGSQGLGAVFGEADRSPNVDGAGQSAARRAAVPGDCHCGPGCTCGTACTCEIGCTCGTDGSCTGDCGSHAAGLKGSASLSKDTVVGRRAVGTGEQEALASSDIVVETDASGHTVVTDGQTVNR